VKILFASDFHFGLVHQGLDRHDEIVRAFKTVVDKSRTVDLVVLGGDVFHSPRPGPREYATVFEHIQEMGCPVAWITGNHEVSMKGDALQPFDKLRFDPPVEIIRAPVIQSFDGIPLLFCPYLVLPMVGMTPDESLHPQEAVDSGFEQARQRGVTAAFCHLDVDGAKVGDEGFMLRGGRLQMPLDVARKLPCDVVNGHIHKRQRMHPNIVMPGSPVAVDFGERKQLHGYCYVMEV